MVDGELRGGHGLLRQLHSVSPTATFNTGLLGGCNDTCVVNVNVDNGVKNSNCTTTLTVNDTVPPNFTLSPVNKTVECDGAGNQAALTAFLGSATAADQCGQPALTKVTNNFNALTPACGATGIRQHHVDCQGRVRQPEDDCGELPDQGHDGAGIDLPRAGGGGVHGQLAGACEPGDGERQRRVQLGDGERSGRGNFMLGVNQTTFTATDGAATRTRASRL